MVEAPALRFSVVAADAVSDALLPAFVFDVRVVAQPASSEIFAMFLRVQA
jgi:hypothetical protein